MSKGWKIIIVTVIFWTPAAIAAVLLGFPITSWQYWVVLGAAMSTAIGEMIIKDMQ